MVKFWSKLIVFSVMILLFTNFSLASVSKGNASYSIETTYGPGQLMTGWINVSLNDQPANSMFQPSFGTPVKLFDLLTESQNVIFDYDCSPSSCSSDYTASTPEKSKSFLLSPGESTIVGFKIVSSKLITELGSFSIKISEINKEAEDTPLIIDFFNDGEIEWKTYNSSNKYKSKNYGCFIDGTNVSNVIIGTNTYCERINFDYPAPEIALGAKVNGSERANFKMSISGDGLASKSCTAAATGTQEINCTISDFKIIPGEYTICITAGTLSPSREYKIKTESKEPCGFAGTEEYPADFEIFAQPKMYSSTGICPISNPNLCVDEQGNGFCIVEECPSASSILVQSSCPTSHAYSCNTTGAEKTPFCINFANCPSYSSLLFADPTNFTINNAEVKKYLGEDFPIEAKMLEYLSSVYNDNCSKGCTIPIKFTSGTRQKITLSNPILTYTAGVTSNLEEIYSLEEIAAKITSGYGRLFLDSMKIPVPKTPGNHTFTLGLGGTNLISQKIVVENAPYITYITPLITGKNYPTTFKLKVNSNRTVSKYKWRFGDGDILETDKGRATHTYTSTGEYVLSIQAINSEGKSTSKNFTIRVENASTIVPALINKTNQSLFVVKRTIVNYSSFEKASINRSLNLEEVDRIVTQLQNNLSANTEAQYEAVLKKLVDNEIPDRLLRTSSGASSKWYLKEDNINVDYLKSLWNANITQTQEDAYKNEIAAWVWANLNLSVGFKEISGDYNGESRVVTYIVNMNLSKKNEFVNSSSLIIKNLENLYFNGDYSQSTREGYVIIPINKLNQELTFSTSEKIDASNLPMVIAPSKDEITIMDIDNTPDANTLLGRKTLFIIVSTVVVLLGGVIWFLLQRWYKRKYEKYLFNDRNNLYNLINYIHDSKKAGVKDNEISSLLKGNGWNAEQISYALKRYKGKRVGMI